VRIYDRDNATGVWMPGARWQIGDDGDALLRMAIRRYLDELYSRYPAPEPNKRDSRLELKNARFVSGVLSEVKPWLPPKSIADFDISSDILPLPNGLVADLRQGQLRAMRREDCQTKRLKIVPANIPTTRFDRFLQEITCGDPTLAAFIMRLLALAITGLSLHVLIFLYGKGRNGKGVLLRLLEKILGMETFAVVINPDEVEYHPGASDRKKRLMGKLRGMRLCYTGETVSGKLDWTLLKTLTGGDTLTGAKLYHDDAGFKPMHTLFLTTNDRPQLPPTAAFKGRLVFVPFNGDFSKSTDMTLEDELAREAPGILWKLIQAAPEIFEHGIQPPASVKDATDDLMDENDIAAPYIEARLTDDADAVTQIPEIENDIKKYLCGIVVGSDARLDRIMVGVRARWPYGRKRVAGQLVRGLLGVRIRAGTR
jgi:putative DNA primase/helicase